MKYVVYKGSGGLAHAIRGLSVAIFFAKKKNMQLIIDMKNTSNLKINFFDFFIIKDDNLLASNDYSIIPSNYKFENMPIDEIKKTIARYDNKECYLNNICISKGIKYNNDVVVIGGHGKIAGGYNIGYDLNIKVNDKIKNDFTKYDIKKKYISIHFRNTDMKHDINLCVKQIINSIHKYDISTIYLATDDYSAYDFISEKLPNIEIIQHVKPENFGGGGLHQNSTNKEKMIFGCLLDMYMILSSDYFIPSNGSGLSHWLCYMMKNHINIFDIRKNTVILEGILYT